MSNSDHASPHYIRNLVSYITPYWKGLIAVFFALTIAAFSVLSIGSLLKHLIDQGFHTSQSTTSLNVIILVLLAIIVLLAIATFFRFYLITRIGEHVIADIRRDVFAHLLTLSPSFFEQRKLGELMSRITSDTTVLQMVIGSSLSIAVRNLFLLCGGLTMLIITSAKLAIYIAIFVPIIILPIVLLGKKVRKLSKLSQAKIAEVSAYTEESIFGIKTIQSYGYESIANALFSNRVNDALGAASQRVKIRGFLTALVITFAFGSVTCILWLGGQEVIAGTMSAGELSSFIFYTVLVAGSFGAISQVIGDLQRAAGAAEDLFTLLETPTDIATPASGITLEKQKNLTIGFNNLSFSYPSTPNKTTLDEISFTVQPGQRIALVGPSGSGKTTLLQLLQRFYDGKSGSITIGDHDIKTIELSHLRELFSYVSQDPTIFSFSAHDNIQFARSGASDAEIIQAAKHAQAHQFITQLPEGYDTYVGEKGVKLSGGERQRIAIARALLKNAPILLLDEATSNLDAENEHFIQKALDELMHNRTSIVIAHRLSTIISADAIAFIDQGKLRDIGTHQELLGRNEHYKELVELQFGRS